MIMEQQQLLTFSVRMTGIEVGISARFFPSSWHFSSAGGSSVRHFTTVIGSLIVLSTNSIQILVIPRALKNTADCPWSARAANT